MPDSHRRMFVVFARGKSSATVFSHDRGKADQSGNHCGFFRGCPTIGCAFSEACTSGAKPPSLFTHVYECKVFARIVCESARCGANARACSMEAAARVDGESVYVREKEREREGRGGGSPSREGVSTLGELPFGVGNNGMRVRARLSFSQPRFTAAPQQADVQKTAASFPISARDSTLL